jgi:hypothetical protein
MAEKKRVWCTLKLKTDALDSLDKKMLKIKVLEIQQTLEKKTERTFSHFPRQ